MGPGTSMNRDFLVIAKATRFGWLGWPGEEMTWYVEIADQRKLTGRENNRIREKTSSNTARKFGTDGKELRCQYGRVICAFDNKKFVNKNVSVCVFLIYLKGNETLTRNAHNGDIQLTKFHAPESECEWEPSELDSHLGALKTIPTHFSSKKHTQEPHFGIYRCSNINQVSSGMKSTLKRLIEIFQLNFLNAQKSDPEWRISDWGIVSKASNISTKFLYF